MIRRALLIVAWVAVLAVAVAQFIRGEWWLGVVLVLAVAVNLAGVALSERDRRRRAAAAGEPDVA